MKHKKQVRLAQFDAIVLAGLGKMSKMTAVFLDQWLLMYGLYIHAKNASTASP